MTPASVSVQVDSILPWYWMLLTLLPQLLSNSFAALTMCQELSTLRTQILQLRNRQEITQRPFSLPGSATSTSAGLLKVPARMPTCSTHHWTTTIKLAAVEKPQSVEPHEKSGYHRHFKKMQAWSRNHQGTEIKLSFLSNTCNILSRYNCFCHGWWLLSNLSCSEKLISAWCTARLYHHLHIPIEGVPMTLRSRSPPNKTQHHLRWVSEGGSCGFLAFTGVWDLTGTTHWMTMLARRSNTRIAQWYTGKMYLSSCAGFQIYPELKEMRTSKFPPRQT